MTLYMNSMWWPPNRSLPAFINQTIFLMLSALTIFNFIMASLSGPRFLPLGWKPKVTKKVIKKTKKNKTSIKSSLIILY